MSLFTLRRWLVSGIFSLGLATLPVLAQTADTTPPTASTSMTATAVSTTKIDLIWSGAADNVGIAGYQIFRGPSVTGPFTLMYTMQGDWRQFSNAGLLPGEKFYYGVKTLDAAGNISPMSSIASAQTPTTADTTSPTAPPSLTVTPVSASQLNLAWPAATDNVAVTGYKVFAHASATAPGTLLATVGNVTGYPSSGLAANTNYWYSVAAFDGAGNNSPATAVANGKTAVGSGDTTPPTASTSMTATAVSTTKIDLIWSGAADNVGIAGYQIFRGPSVTGPFTLMYTMQGDWRQFSNAGLLPGEKFYYGVKTLDAAGNISPMSSIASAQTPTSTTAPDTTAPSVPGNPMAAAGTATQISLNWGASADPTVAGQATSGLNGYRVERCQGASCTSFAQVAAPASTTFADIGLTASTIYRYRVRAADGAGNLSVYSGIASATTPALPDTAAPTAPGSLLVTAPSQTQLNLAWSAATDNVGVTGYKVYRRATATGADSLLVTLGNVLSYQNTGLIADTSYWYSVSALDAASNEGVKSALATARTQAPPADTTPPSVAMTSPASGAVINGATTSCAGASDNVGIVGVQFKRDGANLGSEVMTSPYCVTWNTSSTTPGAHTITATARDAAGNAQTATAVSFYAGVRTDTLQWTTPSATGIVEYRAYYGVNPAPASGGTRITVPVGTTTVNIPNLNWNQLYYYVVTAVYTPGESAPSNEVSLSK